MRNRANRERGENGSNDDVLGNAGREVDVDSMNVSVSVERLDGRESNIRRFLLEEGIKRSSISDRNRFCKPVSAHPLSKEGD